MIRDAHKGQFEWRDTIAPLLGDWVVLLAMKHRRAPLPVSSTLWKVLLRRGFLNDLDELGCIARRLLFLGDSRMLLTELRTRGGARLGAKQTTPRDTEIASGDKSAIRG